MIEDENYDDEMEPSEAGYDDDEAEQPSGLAVEIREQLRSAPWYVSSAFIHMVVLLLLMLIPTSPPEKKKRRFIIKTAVVEEDKIEDKKEEEPDEEKEPDPIEEISESTEEVTSDTVKTEITTKVEISTDIQVEESTDIGDPTDDAIADAGDDLSPKLMGVKSGISRGGLSSGFRGNIAKVGKGIKGMLKGRRSSGRGLLLVWLLDQSASMKDDQEAIAKQARDIQDLLTDGGSKKMLSAVVTFGEKWKVTQQPTTNASKISESIRNVAVDKSGTENTNQAIIFACDELIARYSGWTKVIVLLSDESSSDNAKFYSAPKKMPADLQKTKPGKKKRKNNGLLKISGRDRQLPLIEVAMKRLAKRGARLFVIGKESPFQSTFVREIFKDNNGQNWLLNASRGPETPRIEVPVMFARNTSPWTRGSFTGKLKAGYGVYDLSYLAKGSRGAYFILEDETTTVRKAMSYSERMRNPLTVDWKIMDMYKPDIVSRMKYDKTLRSKRGKWGKTIYLLNKYYEEKGKKIYRWWGCRPCSQFLTRRQNLRNRKKVIVKIIKAISGKLATEKELAKAKNRRQIANLDLFYCIALADQIITETWLDAWERYSGCPVHVNEQGYGYWLLLRNRKGAKLTKKAKKLFEARMARLIAACDDVVRRHPNTPYAQVASWVPAGPQRWGAPAELYCKRVKYTHSVRPKM